MTAPLSALPIDTALCDPPLLGAALGDPSSWGTWLTVLRATFGQPLDGEELATFKELAGGRTPPSKPACTHTVVRASRSIGPPLRLDKGA